jgi:UDP-glucose 4-epimerase
MNFLITGAAGFLGSHLANNLIKEGHHVRGLDDLSAGDPQVLHPSVLFTRGDVNDRPKLWTLLQDVDCVYHLAARVSVPESVLYPREYNEVNVGGTVSLMEAMRDVGVGGWCSSRPARSTASRTSSRSKRPPPQPALALRRLQAGGRVLRAHDRRPVGHRDGQPAVFNAYGPGQHLPPSHPPVIPNFLRQALLGGTLVIHGEAPRPATTSTWTTR